LRNLPCKKDTALGPLKFERKASREPDGSVLFVYRLETAKHRFSVAEAKQITDAVKQPAFRNSFRVDFMPEGTELMSEGKWKEGIALLRRDAASDPPRPNALLRYAFWMDDETTVRAKVLKNGATRQDRTGDLLITNQPLYQLS
jgi:hypothetical protein